MLQIPLQSVPSQQVACLLNNQNCRLAIYMLDDEIYFDLNSNGVDMCLGVIARNLVALDSRNSYDGFQGNLIFVDTKGSEDPQYAGLGTRWALVYLTPAEFALTQVLVVQTFTLLTLSATLNVTASAGGNFSVAHGLSSTPVLIEIIPTAPGLIWAQGESFADTTNINLVASDAGVSATILVYLPSVTSLNYIVPWATLLAVSPEAGPFAVAHGLGSVPSLLQILPTSNGPVWFQAPTADDENLYLEALDSGAELKISVFPGVNTSTLNIQKSVAVLDIVTVSDGNFTLAHGLQTTPSRVGVLMLSGGTIWAQTPAFDATNVYLTASDVGLAAKILLYA